MRSSSSCDGNQPSAFQFAPDLIDALVDGLAIRAHHDIGIERRLIGIGDAREVPYFTRQRTLVEAFDIARRQHFDGAIDMHFDKVAGLIFLFTSSRVSR